MSKFILDIDIDVPDIWYTYDCNLTEEEKKKATKDYINRLWYYKVYCALIEKCQKMESEGYSKDTYTEKHHILPKCMFPDGTSKKDMNKNNIVRMPARYHIMAHILLSFIYPDNFGVVFAASTMFMNVGKRKDSMKHISTKIAAIILENARKKYSETFRGENRWNTGKPLSEEHKQKISEANKGKVRSEEVKKHLSEINKGKKLPEWVKKKMRGRTGEKSPSWGKHLSDETKRKISEANKGRPCSDELRRIRSENAKKESRWNYGNPLPEEIRNKISETLKKRYKENPEWRKTLSEQHKGGNSANAIKVITPSGKIYDCVKEAAEGEKIGYSTLREWLKNKPEKGYKYYTDPTTKDKTQLPNDENGNK